MSLPFDNYQALPEDNGCGGNGCGGCVSITKVINTNTTISNKPQPVTILTENAIQPQAQALVTLFVTKTTGFVSGQTIQLLNSTGGGIYQIYRIASRTEMSVRNLGTSWNAAPGVTLRKGTIVLSVEFIGETLTQVDETFELPACNETADIKVVSSDGLNVGTFIQILTYTLQVTAILGPKLIAAKNLCLPPNVLNDPDSPDGGNTTISNNNITVIVGNDTTGGGGGAYVNTVTETKPINGIAAVAPT